MTISPTQTSRGPFQQINPHLADLAASLAGPGNLGLPVGAAVLLSATMAEALTELPDVLAERPIVLLDGPPGSGKTLLLQLLRARATQLGVSAAVRVQAGRRPSGKQLSASIFSALRPGVPVPRTQNHTEDRLKEVLAAPARALVIYDEAQHLGVRGVEDVRYYWDETPGRFPLVLAGVDLDRLLSGHAQLEDRISYRYHLQLLAPTDSLAFAQSFHPLLAALAQTDPGLLADIDYYGVNGTPRRWTSFLRHALHQLEATAGLAITDAVAYSALRKFVRSDRLAQWSRDTA